MMPQPLSYSTKFNSIEVILKITERCNINCSYCYYFNGGNNDFERMPAIISLKTVESVALFLKQGVLDFGLTEVQVDFHGGEPMMMNKTRFKSMCIKFNDILSPHTKLKLAIQTNATLIDEEWVNIFNQFDIGIGISIDGPKHYNDKYRIDHQGRSTYAKSLKGMTLLNEAHKHKPTTGFAALAVINPEFSAKEIFDHFVEDLGIRQMDFLLPDLFYDNFIVGSEEQYGRYLCDLFDAWFAMWKKPANKDMDIRIINALLAKLGGNLSSSAYGFTEDEPEMLAFTIRSNGELAYDDVLRTTALWDKAGGQHVKETTLRSFLETDFMIDLNKTMTSKPTKCIDCCWVNVCGGGSLINRYTRSNNSLDNPSVYCAGLKLFYRHVTNILLKNGMSVERLKKSLFTPDELAELSDAHS